MILIKGRCIPQLHVRNIEGDKPSWKRKGESKTHTLDHTLDNCALV